MEDHIIYFGIWKFRIFTHLYPIIFWPVQPVRASCARGWYDQVPVAKIDSGHCSQKHVFVDF